MTTLLAVATGVVLAVAAFAIYRFTYVERYYDHFVWQAAAFLEGHAAIRYPVATSAERLGNWFFQDVLPLGRIDGVDRGLIPFPPLPALVLVPFVARFGLETDEQLLFTALAAGTVAICWWMLGRLRVGPIVRLGTTIFFAFGTAFWYSAQNTTTWHQAHIVAVGLTMLAIGAALGADRDDGPLPEARYPLDPEAIAIGLLIGLAATARLTVILGLPFFLLVGPGGGAWRRGWSVVVGAAIPVLALVAYNVATTGQVFHPAYDHLYQLEARAYRGLGYHLEWAAEDPRYLPQNLGIMLLSSPEMLPDRLRDTIGTMDRPLCSSPSAVRALFDAECPLAVPRDIGMSVLLTSPAFLLAIPAFAERRRHRVILGATLAVVLISIANLMHFSQGWVQFGYRFANDTVPFALVLVALGSSRLIDRVPRPRWALPLAIALIAASVAVNYWGVIWGRLLGW